MPQIRFRNLSGPTGQSAETERQVSEGNKKAAAAASEQQGGNACPNPIIAPLDHKVMSKAEKRKEKKNEAPPTKEERETARERLQELRRHQRQFKKNGWRRKLSGTDRSDVAKRRERPEDRATSLHSDAADQQQDFGDDGIDEEERAYVTARMGSSALGSIRNQSGASASSASAAAASSTTVRAKTATTGSSASQLKRHRAEEEG